MQSSLKAVQLYERLEQIQEELLAFDELRSITNNRFLFVGKVNPAILEDFAFVMSRNLIFGFIKFLALMPSQILLKSVYEFLRNCASQLLVPKLSLDSIKSDVVILSHAKEVNFESGTVDSFFGQLENELTKFTSVKTYNLPQYSLITDWRRRQHTEANAKLCRSVGFATFTGILIQNISNTLIVLKTAVSAKNLSMETRLFLTHAAHDQMSRASFNDLIITAELKKIIHLLEASTLIITYEGHPFEVTILNEIPRVFPNLKIVAYQHAPVVGSQLSFFKGLSFFRGNSYLATSGEITKHISINSNPRIAANTFVLGSPKFSHDEVCIDDKDPSKRFLRILVAPEASIEAVIEALAGTNRYIDGKEKVKLVLRLHPRLQISKEECFEFIQKNPKLTVSKNTLRFDLMHADLCMYRSSAVCIQSMHYGVVPHYVSNYPAHLLDPLYLIAENKLFGPALSEQYQEESGLNSAELIMSFNGKQELQIIADKYFSHFSIDSIKTLVTP
jgi:hypothetical protein